MPTPLTVEFIGTRVADITFADDYELESIEYRLNTQGTNEWTIIAEDINDDSYTEEWSLSVNDWDDLEEDVIYYLYFRVTDICGNEYITPDNDEAPMLTKDVSPPIADYVTFDLYQRCKVHLKFHCPTPKHFYFDRTN